MLPKAEGLCEVGQLMENNALLCIAGIPLVCLAFGWILALTGGRVIRLLLSSISISVLIAAISACVDLRLSLTMLSWILSLVLLDFGWLAGIIFASMRDRSPVPRSRVTGWRSDRSVMR